MAISNSSFITRYYHWHGDACRVKKFCNGDQIAEVYRGGEGLVRVNAADVLAEAEQIGPGAYDELVLSEIARFERRQEGRHQKEMVASLPT
jgi:hypothetical protein